MSHTASSYGTVGFTPDADADGFVAYDSLTEEVVMGWVHAEVDQDATEAALTANIAGQKNPVYWRRNALVNHASTCSLSCGSAVMCLRANADRNAGQGAWTN